MIFLTQGWNPSLLYLLCQQTDFLTTCTTWRHLSFGWNSITLFTSGYDLQECYIFSTRTGQSFMGKFQRGKGLKPERARQEKYSHCRKGHLGFHIQEFLTRTGTWGPEVTPVDHLSLWPLITTESAPMPEPGKDQVSESAFYWPAVELGTPGIMAFSQLFQVRHMTALQTEK